MNWINQKTQSSLRRDPWIIWIFKKDEWILFEKGTWKLRWSWQLRVHKWTNLVTLFRKKTCSKFISHQMFNISFSLVFLWSPILFLPYVVYVYLLAATEFHTCFPCLSNTKFRFVLQYTRHFCKFFYRFYFSHLVIPSANACLHSCSVKF